MSATAREDGRLAPGTASAVWPVVVLAAVAGACWAVTVERMRGMDMGPATPLGGLGWFAVVWLTMMAAMMLPSLSPMAVAYSRGAAGGRARSIAGTVVFAVGYLLPWAAFGVVAYALVDGVRSLDLGVLAWDRAGRYVAGWVILATAIYELTAAKGSCLQHCRDTLLLRRRPGAGGALRMGIEQGGFCVGCSGALMVVLFALGVMSITWMLVIAAVIAIEKLVPRPAVAVGLTAVTLTLLGLRSCSCRATFRG
jgi:predicted metal-binding membrane protein